MNNLRIGVVGVGHIGSNHARLYAEIPSAEFTAVYDVDPFRSRTIGGKFGAIPAKSLDEFIEMVDASCVANVTSSRISPERLRKIRIFQEDAYLSLDYQNQSGEIYRRIGGRITRDRVDIERGEALKLQLTSFIECASTGREPRVSGSQATAALKLAVEITKRIAPSG